MAKIVEQLERFCNFLINSNDPRTKDYFLVENPLNIIFIVMAYIYFVKKLGPQVMENRKPFKLQKLLMMYNLLQIIVNFYIFWEGYRLAWGWGTEYRILCEPVDLSNSPGAVRMAKVVHLFFMVKLIDLLDTVFMVLRKKQDHVSFLHVYHHAGMFALTWGVTKYFPGGHVTFTGFINSFIHTLMYTYYLLATIFPPEQRKLLWWKKYLTLLQMAQFAICGVHMILPLFLNDCEKHITLGAFLVVPNVFFLTVLFLEFYKKSYLDYKDNK